MCALTILQIFQIEECRQNWVCHGLGGHQLTVRQGSDAEQKTAIVQCHCLPDIIKEALSRQLGLAGLLAITLTFFSLLPTHGGLF